MPESFFILSKENLELAKDEIIAIAKTYDRFAKSKSYSNLVIIQSKINWEKIAKRATFVKMSGQILRKMSGLFQGEEKFEILKKELTFACRIINLSSKQFQVEELESSMGDMISKLSQAKVNLEDPDIFIYLIFTNQQNFFGFSKPEKIPSRPKKIRKHPHELDWKLARTMINLIGLKEGDIVCDPFCGTGTILLEAESMGMKAVGVDFDEKMCNITKQNLEVNGFNSKIINGDFSKFTTLEDKFDAIVTDLPYGIASKASENPQDLIKKFVSMLPRRKKIAIMCKKGFEKKLKMNPSKTYDIYRHKSLTRTILIR
jgi:tRNA (guanine10-N2)-dimethyltransferase